MSSAQNILGTNSVNRTTDLFRCADRVSPGDEPRDITAIKELYIPFDVTNKSVQLRKNPFGAVIYKNEVAAGNVYHAFDGRRLVLEIGCSTIIFIHINPILPSKHHRVFIQSDRAFSGDTTIRRDSALIAKNTQHIETIVKYEMFFIMGVLSTASLAAWIMVTGTDVTVMYARNYSLSQASKDLVNALAVELNEIESYAPVLHAKILELIITEGQSTAVSAAKRLPKVIISDEKVQAQVAGVIFGKWAMPNGNPFSLWTVLSVILTQAAVKSVTKYGDAYLSALDNRYNHIVEEMKAVDLSRPATLQAPAQSLIKLMGEAGVNLSTTEAQSILVEISSNKDKAFKNLKNITRSIDQFRKVATK